MNTEFQKLRGFYKSQADIARDFDVTEAYISQIANGKRGISVDLAYKMVHKYPQLNFIALVKPESEAA